MSQPEKLDTEKPLKRGGKARFRGYKSDLAKHLKHPRRGETVMVVELIHQARPGARVEDRRGRKFAVYLDEIKPLSGRRPLWMIRRTSTLGAG